MRRYTDFFVMLAILVLNIAVALILWNTVEAANDANSFTVSYSLLELAMLAIPGVSLSVGLSLARAIWNLPPRSFYMVVLIGAVISAAVTWGVSFLFTNPGPIGDHHLTDSVFTSATIAVAAIVGLILGLTNAVPSPEKHVGAPISKEKTEKSAKKQKPAAPSNKEIKAVDTEPKSIESDRNMGDKTSNFTDPASPRTAAGSQPRRVNPDEFKQN